MSDHILFILPGEPEADLAAIAAIQGFAKWQHRMAAKMKRKLDVQYFYGVSNFDCYHGALPRGECVPRYHFDVSLPLRGEYDLIHKFNAAKAYEISLPTQMHMSQVFAIQIGADAAQLPDMRDIMQSEENTHDIFVSNSTKMKEEIEIALRCAAPNLTIGTDPEFCRLIVAERGGLSYHMAAMGKAVYELYPNDRHRDWLAKWQNPLYRMYYSDTFKLDTIISGVLELWKTHTLSAAKSDPSSRTPTAPETSSAVSAES